MRLLITGGSGFIGTNLIEMLLKDNTNFINVDINKPKLSQHETYWKQCDILNQEKLVSIFFDFNPTHVLHLAARTDIEGASIDDYKVNTKGSQNVIDAVKVSKSVERFILTSTQFVHQFKDMPKDDEDFAPYTMYGESKAMSEKMIRSSNLSCIWTIIRPTNIWGPGTQDIHLNFGELLAKENIFIREINK